MSNYRKIFQLDIVVLTTANNGTTDTITGILQTIQLNWLKHG